ncbi:DUF2218 domain-containing protein [Pukyongiella litopenaei]|uniref:DUF2218 domain-containing protein n=1 Tax=Pukyongiella litopenaei TaxID=2605946 RepID=A0A2S0MU73_9RHOB|nr:DUF2218 domain-containing protein [Pukyongiella litopenaei]AVO39412.1 DUF2218 domain-containing protein [Pukyongiella litopenaei]
MLTNTAIMPTAHARKYLQQMCKHFAHKIEVAYSETDASCAFPFGKAQMFADDAALRFEVAAEDAENLDRARQVIESHILRFAFREKIEALDWQG